MDDNEIDYCTQIKESEDKLRMIESQINGLKPIFMTEDDLQKGSKKLGEEELDHIYSKSIGCINSQMAWLRSDVKQLEEDLRSVRNDNKFKYDNLKITTDGLLKTQNKLVFIIFLIASISLMYALFA